MDGLAGFYRRLLKDTVLENPYIIHKPSRKQAKFLLLPQLEAFYGGAAGGGKSDALLMGALQYVAYPDYTAIILRKTFQDLSLPNALMDRASVWLGGRAVWSGLEHSWLFPSGARVMFGYMETEQDRFRYQGAEFQFIGIDEATEFSESQYTFLFSRLRRKLGSKLPLRMRAASNPGGRGHDWVKQRFITEGRRIDDEEDIWDLPLECRPFMPARLEDNIGLDQESYEESLRKLDNYTYKQLRYGDWDVSRKILFEKEWFETVDNVPMANTYIRYWDLASTTKGDYTVGLLLTVKDGVFYVLDVQRTQGKPMEVENMVRNTAQRDNEKYDGKVQVYMEQEPGSSGVTVIDHYSREVLVGYPFYGLRSTGDKKTRALPVVSAGEAGNIKLLRGEWNNTLLDELDVFPQGSYDDQVDSLSGAFNILASAVGKGDLNAWYLG